MNNVIMAEVKKPVKPSTNNWDKSGSAVSCLNPFFGWLDRRDYAAEKREANRESEVFAGKMLEYKHKLSVWEEVTNYTHVIFIDTNILFNNRGCGFTFEELVDVAAKKGWKVVASSVVLDELNWQISERNKNKTRARVAEKADAAKARLEKFNIEIVDGSNVVLPAKNATLPRGSRYDKHLEAHAVDLIKSGAKVFFLSDDGDHGVTAMNKMHEWKIDKSNYAQFNTHRFKTFVSELEQKMYLLNKE